MKRNTKKLLFTLYSPDGNQGLRVSRGREIFSDLSDGGYRSWLFQLKKQGLIYTDQPDPGLQPSLHLTQKGERAVRQAFPALSDKWDTWQGTWQLMIFLTAPKSDLQFRYLRKLLIEEGAMPISRGSYIFPNACSERVMHEVELRYADSVAICSVDEWVYGLERPLIIDYYDLNLLTGIYSSIGNSIDRLLVQNDDKKRLINKHKLMLFSELDRLFEIAQDDPGFVRYYYPEVAGVRQILPRIHQLLQL